MAGPSAKGPAELWLFTMRFPYGHGEAFLENELPVLSAGFGRVRIFPLHAGGTMRELPGNVEVVDLFGQGQEYRPISVGGLLARAGSAWALWRQGRSAAPDEAVFNRHKREFLSQIRQALERQRLLERQFGPAYHPARVRLYSYWTSDWATVLGLWKRRDARVRFHTRMHGFDMFRERAVDGWPRFQHFHLQQADRIYIASQAGLDYMADRHPGYRDRFKLAYVATQDHGLAPWAPADTLRVLSCSNLIELKRVPLIAASLAHVQSAVQWTHFGAGPERKAVEQMAATLPANVQVNLMGSRPNSEVIDWYKHNPVDVFVHASRTEGGAPVALKEAASFGIPLVAADAGGVREIVTGETGVLLPNDLSAETLGHVLAGFRQTTWYAQQAREKVRAFWAARFDAHLVYHTMVNDLSLLDK